MPFRFSDDDIERLLRNKAVNPDADSSLDLTADVFIAGSGPIGAAYARTIFEQHSSAKIIMAEMGAQDSPVIGAHLKNSIRYQKNLDAFIHIVIASMQPVSVPPPPTYNPNLAGDAWRPKPGVAHLTYGSNPRQVLALNLGEATSNTVGGMGTHWTCCCPRPHKEERISNPIDEDEFDQLLTRAERLLRVHTDQYDCSIRHRVIKNTLIKTLGGDRQVQSLPLAVERRMDNPNFVTWTGTDVVFGQDILAEVAVTSQPRRFTLMTETMVVKLVGHANGTAQAVLVRDLRKDEDFLVFAKAFVICCGVAGTPQVLFNSKIRPPALGRYLSHQSHAFCQVVLKRTIVEGIKEDPEFQEELEMSKGRFTDSLAIPLDDPEPQVWIPYSHDYPFHCQIHRDSFSYGGVGPRADPRVVVDLRYFGRHDLNRENRVFFVESENPRIGWEPGVTDIHGMPQPTFEVTTSREDDIRDQEMMRDMTAVANVLGSFLPGSAPQFLKPGAHVTGTTRIGKPDDIETSVADLSSKVHGLKNVWVGGNGCIPDSTACNPTLTSIAIALKGASSVVEYLDSLSLKTEGKPQMA